MNSTLWRRITFNLVVVAIILLAGSGAFFALSALAKPPEPRDENPWAPLVDTQALQQGEYPRSLNVYGALEAGTMFLATAEMNGRIHPQSPIWRSGDVVKAGDLLVHIDAISVARGLASTSAEITRLQAELERVRSQAESDRALLEVDRQQLALANKLLASDRAAFAKGSLSERSVDAREQTALNYQAALIQRQQSVRNAPFTEQALLSAIDAAQAQQQEFATLQQRSKIVAPFTGVVTMAAYDKQQSVTAGQHLLTLIPSNDYEVQFHVSIADWQSLAQHHEEGNTSTPYAHLSLSFSPAGSDLLFTGSIDRIEGQSDPQRRQLIVIGQLADNPDLQTLPLGSFGQIRIQGAALKGYRIAQQAIIEDAIWTVDGQMKLHRIPVQAQALNADEAIIPPSAALADGTMVVLHPSRQLTDGMTVQFIQQAPSETLTQP